MEIAGLSAYLCAMTKQTPNTSSPTPSSPKVVPLKPHQRRLGSDMADLRAQVLKERLKRANPLNRLLRRKK